MISYYTVRLPENNKSAEQAVSLLLKEFYTIRKFLLIKKMCVQEFSEQRFFAFISLCAD